MSQLWAAPCFSRVASTKLRWRSSAHWPGLGPLLVSAIFKRDVDVVTASVLLSTLLLVLGNLVADILLYVIDPRTRVVHGATRR